MKTFILFLSILFSIASYAGENPATKQEREREAIAAFQSGDKLKMQNMAQSLSYSGLTSTAVFDVLEAKFVEYAANATKDDRNLIAWMALGLGSSGNAKYLPTLEKALGEVEGARLKKHIKEAIELIDEFQILNQILGNTQGYDESEPWQHHVYNNMIWGDDASLKEKVAVMAINKQIVYPTLLDNISANLAENHKTKSGDSDLIRAQSYMSKALARSGQSKYEGVLQEMSESAGDKKIRRYAKKHLAYLKKNKIVIGGVSGYAYGGEKYSSVTITVDGPIKEDPTKLESLNQANLQTVVDEKIRASGLYDSASPNTIEILITSYRLRNSTGAVLLSTGLGVDLLGGQTNLIRDAKPAVDFEFSVTNRNQYGNRNARLARAFANSLVKYILHSN